MLSPRLAHLVPSRRTGRAVLTELAAAAAALAVSVLSVRHLLASDRSWILLHDADSVLPALLSSSLAHGQAQDWALSSVLFIPEAGLYLGLGTVTSGPRATLVAYAVVSLLVLYGVLRAVSAVLEQGSRRRSVAAALGPFALAAILVCLDHSADRHSLELASLLLTPTYYGATVLAMLLGVALAARVATHDRSRVTAVLLVLLVAGSTLTNPLIVPWLVLPLLVVLALALRRRLLTTRRAGLVAALVAAGTAVGFVGRVPLSGHIAVDGADYAHPSQIARSAFYYASKAYHTLAAPRSVVAFALVGALLVGCVLLTRWAVRRADVAAYLVATTGWVAALLVCVGACVLGTDATRYLAPLVFAPLLGAVVAVQRLPARTIRPAGVLAGVTGAALLVVALVPVRTGPVVSARVRDAQCVVSWIDAHPGRVGAGTYWDGRPVKAYLDDQSQLVQVFADLHRYPWLVDRADDRVDRVSFLVQGSYEPLDLPTTTVTPTVVECGQYRIEDYGSAVVALGSPVMSDTSTDDEAASGG